MHTASSARRTCIRSRSAFEYTATVRMPSSRQARRIRSAISPRLAIRTFPSMATSDDADQRLVEFHRLAVFNQDGVDDAGLVRLDLVHHFHCFDDAQHFAGTHLLANFDKGVGARRG